MYQFKIKKVSVKLINVVEKDIFSVKIKKD